MGPLERFLALRQEKPVLKIRLLALHCDLGTRPQFTLITRNPMNSDGCYMWDTETGSEPVIRSMLLAGGMSDPEVDQRVRGALGLTATTLDLPSVGLRTKRSGVRLSPGAPFPLQNNDVFCLGPESSSWFYFGSTFRTARQYGLRLV